MEVMTDTFDTLDTTYALTTFGVQVELPGMIYVDRWVLLTTLSMQVELPGMVYVDRWVRADDLPR